MHNVQPNTPATEPQLPVCGARKPGWENGPAIGRHRIPCVLSAGHEDAHRDGLGQTWTAVASAEPQPTRPVRLLDAPAATALAVRTPSISDADFGATPLGILLRATTDARLIGALTRAAEEINTHPDDATPGQIAALAEIAHTVADSGDPSGAAGRVLDLLHRGNHHPAAPVTVWEKADLDPGIALVFKQYPDRMRAAYDPAQTTHAKARELLAHFSETEADLEARRRRILDDADAILAARRAAPDAIEDAR